MPLTTNRGQSRHAHWAQRAGTTTGYAARASLARNPSPPPAPLQRVRLAYHVDHGGSVLMDWDNLAARLKDAQDWLVCAGYIADDSPKVIPAPPALSQCAKRKPTDRGITITITPCA